MQLSTRVQGGVRGHGYAQPEGLLGESMVRSSRKLGETNVFAQSLNEMGEALKQMSEIKFSLEDNVKQNFLDPLGHLQNKEIKDVNVRSG
jgi:endophilin-A